jgi:hypothetical protein
MASVGIIEGCWAVAWAVAWAGAAADECGAPTRSAADVAGGCCRCWLYCAILHMVLTAVNLLQGLQAVAA